MNRSSSAPVQAVVFRLITILVVPVLLASCASRREVWKDLEIKTGSHEPGTALNCDYLVRNGANLEVAYASGCRFYIEKGGRFRGLARGVHECTVYAEKGAKVEQREGVRVVWVDNARKQFSDRDKVVLQPLGPGIRTGGGPVRYDDDDDDDYDYDDDDDDDYRSSRSGSVRISGSSYKKKNN